MQEKRLGLAEHPREELGTECANDAKKDGIEE
jgi:hypothetical protein